MAISAISKKLEENKKLINSDISKFKADLDKILSNIPEGDEGIHFFRKGGNDSLIEIFPNGKNLGNDKYNLLAENIPNQANYIITRGKINGDSISLDLWQTCIYAGGDVNLEKSDIGHIFSGGNININDSEGRASGVFFAKGDIFAGNVGDKDFGGGGILVAGGNITVLDSQAKLVAGGNIEVVGNLDNSAHALGNIKAELVRYDFLPEHLYAGGNITVRNAIADMYSGGDIVFTSEKAELTRIVQAKGNIHVNKIDHDFYNSRDNRKYYGSLLRAQKLYSSSDKKLYSSSDNRLKYFDGEFIHVENWKEHVGKITKPSIAVDGVSFDKSALERYR